MAGNKLKMSAILMQSVASVTIAYLTVLTGFVYAWPSYTIENFRSNNTVLSSPMNTMQVSLLGSLTNVGALVVTPMCGYTMDKIGRKYSAMLFGLPYVICWGIISITTSVPLVIAAIGLSGVSTAGQAVSSVYIGEICHESIRGALTSTTVSGYYIGLMISYVLGGYLTYYQITYTNLSLSMVYILLLILLKESPVYLMKNGKEQEAAESIAFYRRVDVISKEVEIEIAKIKLQLDPKLEQTLEADNGEKSRSTRRALCATIMVISLTILMGSIALQVYAEPLFQEAVPTMSANMCSIFLALDYVIATLICTPMLDKFGRKFLLTRSSLGSGIFSLLLATQLQLQWAPHWFTVFCIYGYCFVYNLGAAVVPFVLVAEVFLPERRGFGTSMSMAFVWLMYFVTLLIFNPITEAIGLGPLFFGFSVVCFIGAIYSQYCLPETKGLTVDAIQLAFLGKKQKTGSMDRNINSPGLS